MLAAIGAVIARIAKGLNRRRTTFAFTGKDNPFNAFGVLALHWAAISVGTQLMIMVVSYAVKPSTTAQSARLICALCHAFKSTMNGNLLGAAERQLALSHLPS